MSPTCRLLVEQCAQWCSVEQCWEVFCPLPNTISTPLPNGGSMLEIALEWLEWAKTHDIRHTMTALKEGQFFITGIHFKE